MRHLKGLILGLCLGITPSFFVPGLCLAQELTLRDQITDGDGTITASDVFENAETISDLVLGYRQGATATLDAGSVQSVIMRAGAIWNNPRGVRRIMVAAGTDAQIQGQAAQVTQKASVASASSAKTQEVLVFTHAMNTGDMVTANDIEYRQVQAHQVPQGVPHDPSSLMGKVVRWPIRDASVVKLSDLMSPIVVKRNENVAVTWSSNGVSLGVTGVAQKDGAVGDIISVINPTSKKPIDVLITGPGQGVAGPMAQTMRQNMMMASQ